MNLQIRCALIVLACLCAAASAPRAAQSMPQSQAANAKPAVHRGASRLPKDYVIGAEDVLNVVFWSATSKDLSAEVLVRPDGKISLPILNDVPAAGMTPEQLAAEIAKAATKFVRDPGATVIVKAVHSRKFYVVGEVARPGPFPLGSEMNVLQAIGEAGGFLETAKKGDVVDRPHRKRQGTPLQVQLQRRRQRQEHRAEHPAPARRHDPRSVDREQLFTFLVFLALRCCSGRNSRARAGFGRPVRRDEVRYGWTRQAEPRVGYEPGLRQRGAAGIQLTPARQRSTVWRALQHRGCLG